MMVFRHRLDNLAAETAASMTTHRIITQLATRIAISNLHSNTKKSFSETMNDMFNYVNQEMVNMHRYFREVHKSIMDNAEFFRLAYYIQQISTTIILVLKPRKIVFAKNKR
jgi:hypothetical protein